MFLTQQMCKIYKERMKLFLLHIFYVSNSRFSFFLYRSVNFFSLINKSTQRFSHIMCLCVIMTFFFPLCVQVFVSKKQQNDIHLSITIHQLHMKRDHSSNDPRHNLVKGWHKKDLGIASFVTNIPYPILFHTVCKEPRII